MKNLLCKFSPRIFFLEAKNATKNFLHCKKKKFRFFANLNLEMTFRYSCEKKGEDGKSFPFVSLRRFSRRRTNEIRSRRQKKRRPTDRKNGFSFISPTDRQRRTMKSYSVIVMLFMLSLSGEFINYNHKTD